MTDPILFGVIVGSLLIGSQVTKYRQRKRFEAYWVKNWKEEVALRGAMLEENLIECALVDAGSKRGDLRLIENKVAANSAIIEFACQMLGYKDENAWLKHLDIAEKRAFERIKKMAHEQSG